MMTPVTRLSLYGLAAALVGGCASDDDKVSFDPTPESGGADSGGQDTGPPDGDPDDTDGPGGDTDTAPEVVVETAQPELEWATPCSTQAAPVQTGEVVDAALNELSGLTLSRRDPNVLWTHEDHAGDPAIYALDPDGNTLATITLDGATNNDWEDIATGPCGEDTCIFIGEIGNNELDRTELGVYVLPEPDLETVVDGALTTADWVYYGLEYPGENRNAEALVVTTEGLPVVLSKHHDVQQSHVYIYPSLDAAADTVLTELGTIVTGPEGDGPGSALTSASLWPDGSRLVFRTYAKVQELDLAGGLSAISSATISTLAGATETHGEAVAYDPWRGGFWQVAEGVNAPLWYIGCGE